MEDMDIKNFNRQMYIIRKNVYYSVMNQSMNIKDMFIDDFDNYMNRDMNRDMNRYMNRDMIRDMNRHMNIHMNGNVGKPMYSENENKNNTYNKEDQKKFFEREEKNKSFIVDSDHIINIKFEYSSRVIVISIDKFRPLKDLFKVFANKVGIPEFLLGKEVIFILDSKAIDVNDEKRAINDYIQRDYSTIIVIEKQQNIGVNK